MASILARPLLAVSRTCFLQRAVSLKSLARYKLQGTPRYMSTISSKIQVNGVEIHYEVAGQSTHVVLCSAQRKVTLVPSLKDLGMNLQ